MPNCKICDQWQGRPHICWPRAPEPLTVDWIERAVATVEAINYPTDSHIAEDKLHQFVLKAIAQGKAGDLASIEACAAAALETLELDFDRWYE